MALHGGDLTLESEPGIKTTITMRFPASRVVARLRAARADAPDSSAIAAGAVAPDLPAGLSILIAEDNPINRKLIALTVQAAGHHAHAVNGGAEALAALDTAADDGRHYDILLLDIQMPGMDGLETATRIRQRQDVLANLPIIALTAETAADRVAAYQAAGMQGYVSKPVDSDHLWREVSRLIA